MSNTSCQIDGCERASATAGYCHAHYKRIQLHGDPLADVPIRRVLAEECFVEGCSAPPVARDLCSRHYAAWHRNGDPLIDKRPIKPPCSIEGCERPHNARGLCGTHYSRWQKWGDPLATGPNASVTPEDRFWAQVDKSGECWVWTGTVTGKGYGTLTSKGKRHSAHRFSYVLANGPIPDGMFVCHACDNPRCVRPDHLFVGDNTANMRDASSKGRLRAGAKHPMALRAKLSADDVRAVRLDTRSTYALAKVHGVSSSTIQSIRAGKTYAWVE